MPEREAERIMSEKEDGDDSRVTDQ